MTMKEYWFPWYPGRFKADTMHLTALQDGIYRRLIDHYMETRLPLPDNDIALARIAGVSVEDFVDNSGIIRGFFKADKSSRLVHKKCAAILKEQEKISKSYAKRGAKGGKTRAQKAKEKQDVTSYSQAIAKAQPKQEPSIIQAHNITQHNKTRDKRDSLPSNHESKDSPSVGESRKNKRGSFSIEKFLRESERERAKAAAPGWDIYVLMREFDERVNSGRFETPEKPGAAFVGWVVKFTKGERPD